MPFEPTKSALRVSTSRLRARCKRAGPALPSYLALHHAGFAMRSVSRPDRWALTPPFHPYLMRPQSGRHFTQRACGRRAAGFPAACHRSIRRAGGIFSVALSVTRFWSGGLAARRSNCVPWRYQARCPSVRGVFRRGLKPEALRHRATVSGLSSRPESAATSSNLSPQRRSQRSPGPPARPIVTQGGPQGAPSSYVGQKPH